MPARSGRFELFAASVLTGVFGAATIYVSELHLGLEAFAPLAQLWTFWALFAASITFSVQHWVIRAVVSGIGDRRASQTLARLLVPVAVAVTVVSWGLSESWFDGHKGFAVLCGLLVLGTGMNGYGRGYAAAQGPDRLLAVIIVGENLIRLALLVPLIIFDAAPIWFGITLLAGFLINVIARPRRVERPEIATSASGAAPIALLVTGAVGLISYATMFGGPLLLGPAGVSAAAISALFLVITLARIPFIVILGLLPRVALHLELLVSGGRHAELHRFTLRVTAVAVVAGAVIAGVAVFAADRTVGRLLGTSDHFGSSVYALVGAASVLSLASLVVSMTFVAQQRHTVLIATWLLPIVAVIAGVGFDWFSSVQRLSVWLVVVELVMVAVLTTIQMVTPRSG
jgi:hypothetical protein